jgi:hypothetical protein
VRTRDLFTRDGLKEAFKPRPRVPRQAAGTRPSPQPRPGSPAPARGAPGLTAPAAQSAPAVGSPELEQRRDRLARELAELQWDLGGMAYEMASRDHFRLDVLIRQSARLQQVDAELAEVERLLHLEHAGAAGTCPKCGALYARGAVFCWQCGGELMQQAAVAAVPR